ncbi:hypothetical protein NIES4074_52360 [Cylindrospermum sp. NIES-4074]|nr:hypothetical protein NIES4074_52360 [Cylindrospermum sp. NIES-4074]
MKSLHQNLSIAASSLITLGALIASPAEATTLVFSGQPQNTWQVSLSYDENNINYSTLDGQTFGTVLATNLTIDGYIGSYDNSNDYGWWHWTNVGDTINFYKSNFSDPLEPLQLSLWVHPPVPSDANYDAKFGGVGSLILDLETLGNINKGWMNFEDGWFATGGYTFGGSSMDYKVSLGFPSTSFTSVPEPATTTSLMLFGLLGAGTLLLKKAVQLKAADYKP